MSAALSAKEAGARHVVILEKEPVVGGATYRAEDGLAATGTNQQKKLHIEDSAQAFAQSLSRFDRNERHQEMISVLTEKSNAAVQWLVSLGADLSSISSGDDQGAKRLHHPTSNYVGQELIRVLYNAVIANKIDLRLQQKALDLLTDSHGRVTGVHLKDLFHNKEERIYANSVVLATGGFGANLPLVQKYVPELKGMESVSAPGNNGDALTMGRNVGAAVADLGTISVHPTAVPNKGILISQEVIKTGAVLINQHGKRFVNEEADPSVVANHIQNQDGRIAFVFFDEKVREQCKRIEDYVHTPFTVAIAPDLKSIAGKMQVPAGKLEEQITQYRAMATKGLDEQFKRPSMPSTLEKHPNFYAIAVAPAIVMTHGGLRINEQAQVLDESGKPIEGLFAAGEVVDGVHSRSFLDGVALTNAIVFGRIAGENAIRVHAEQK